MGLTLGLRRGRWLVAVGIYALPAVLLLAVTLPHLDQGDFRGDTGWYSAIAVQGWRTGDLWTLFGEPGQPYFNKPPLVFWIHGLVLHIFGVSLVVARLPTIAAAVGCVVLTVAIARELTNRRAAVLSGIVLALSLEFFRRVREISLDMWQLLFMLLAVWLVAAGVKRGRGGLVLASGLGVGLALLCKPLTGLVFFPVAGVWLAWIGQRRLIGALIGGFALALLVPAPWHVSMIALHGREFLSQYFGAEIAERAAGRLADPNRGASPPWFYAQQIVAGYWPWLLCIAGAAVRWWRAGRIWPKAELPRLAVLWTAAWFVLLSIYADRRDRYGLSLYPGLAWVCGMWLAVPAWEWVRGATKWALRWLAPVAAVGAAAFAIAPVRVQREPDPQWPRLFAWMSQEGLDGSAGKELWQGGFIGPRGARVYLDKGWWPRTTRNRWGDFIAEPPRGALLVYHRRDGLAPGEGEVVVFETGDLKVTRLDGATWKPVPAPDPGE